jgi:hypothetical protein
MTPGNMRAKSGLHGIFVTSYGIPNARGGLSDLSRKLIRWQHPFAALARRLVTKIGGNCDSCQAMINGKSVLYDDEFRYDVLNGVKHNPTPPFSQP